MPFSKKKQNKICIPLAPYRNGLVLRGYDVVEYHNLAKSAKGVPGNDIYKYVFPNEGANYTFYFKNQANLDKFRSDPERYLPRFGGFCSWGFANEWGSTVNGQTVGDPNIPTNCQGCINNPPWPWTQYIMGPPADTDYGWSVYKDNLYFNINSSYRRLWLSNADIFIERANKRWAKYYGDKVGPLNVQSYPWNWRDSSYLTERQAYCLRQSGSMR